MYLYDPYHRMPKDFRAMLLLEEFPNQPTVDPKSPAWL